MIGSKIKAAAVALCAMLLSSNAQAATVNSVTVSYVGMQGTQMYIISPDIPAACGGVMYQTITSSTPYMMSLALSARLGNIKIARIDYTQGTPCTIELIQL